MSYKPQNIRIKVYLGKIIKPFGPCCLWLLFTREAGEMVEAADFSVCGLRHRGSLDRKRGDVNGGVN
ncbi:hypothetical protein A2473_00185 [candidate division WWE3 bacterium RIFOXYC2_FULL_42_13]|uniref:Uncharacterized protein n=1 Tax=candidate division WWE3 bacterium TaxID=2053526 RepID=A0A3D0ZS42_UNCKA|nr:MAG: hypothetical protein A2245_03765 [candidate division WWE3 bacterium RIFOXYA2_FULL_43_12]OGC65611.1 MAG: hypothetical protein A2274_02635 [candidate division WWE3 bacterium RIFOXYA12_FULL_43_11]OGC74143.1 MAG: hypothetical protein A2473_00185 [candidate division WWE3 bacterium RIFOXYC2_FULL_42_13]OGC75913.1 MAG: hypothetical protein A2547_01505 [candidate division WWE3 bacterium RIFOXYD2_FULL_43_10]HBY09936.1 hypothetical protein [candidate division WWE3 bacterium]